LTDQESGVGFVADTMVLAMFVDAGKIELLVSLADGRLFVTPTVADADEIPPYAGEPGAEFARGLFRSQAEAGAQHANRVARRTAFYHAIGEIWSPVALTETELRDAQMLLQPATRISARTINPAFKFKRVGGG
jgi:hypothetical protein